MQKLERVLIYQQPSLDHKLICFIHENMLIIYL